MGDAPRGSTRHYRCISGPLAFAQGFDMKNAGFITTGTLVVASVSALFLMAACHSSPPQTHGFANTAADNAAEARLDTAGTMPHIAPYDEGFYAAPAEEAASAAP